ncbi:hypothetical protein DPMN_089878 [Dreissena polymorpha]|uniref:Uncharacterized protein n=1 Tax=Dreissena polymorpha TaxID=45954 RepID=A0A9D4KWQ8_DREPO|nr:hypothetical protein DPMN_089878 [Dreissena polymorpha]
MGELSTTAHYRPDRRRISGGVPQFASNCFIGCDDNDDDADNDDDDDDDDDDDF